MIPVAIKLAQQAEKAAGERTEFDAAGCAPASRARSVGALAGQQFTKTDVFTGTESSDWIDLFRQDFAPTFGIFSNGTIVYENPVNLAQNE